MRLFYALVWVIAWLINTSCGRVGAFCTESLIRVIYEVGAFTEEAVHRTVWVTVLAGALVPLAMNKLLIRCFHAAGLEFRQ